MLSQYLRMAWNFHEESGLSALPVSRSHSAMLFLYRLTACLCSTSSVMPCFSPPGPMSSRPTWDACQSPSWRLPSGSVSPCCKHVVPLCNSRAGVEICDTRGTAAPFGPPALGSGCHHLQRHLHVTCCRSTDDPAALSRLTWLQWLPDPQSEATCPQSAGWCSGCCSCLPCVCHVDCGVLRLAAQPHGPWSAQPMEGHLSAICFAQL